MLAPGSENSFTKSYQLVDRRSDIAAILKGAQHTKFKLADYFEDNAGPKKRMAADTLVRTAQKTK